MPVKELEVEAVRVLNEKIFYYGVRKWVHRAPVPRIDRVIEADIVSFLEGAPSFIATLHCK